MSLGLVEAWVEAATLREREMAGLKASCGNCSAWVREKGKQGICRARPPVPLIVGMQKQPGFPGLSPTQVSPLVSSFFPPMLEVGWCREWEPRVDMEGEFMKAARETNGQQAQDEAQAPSTAA